MRQRVREIKEEKNAQGYVWGVGCVQSDQAAFISEAPVCASTLKGTTVLSVSEFGINFPRPDVSLTALTVDLPLTVVRQKYVIESS
jgi:hypothetical protein